MCRSSRSGTARTRSSSLGPRLQGAKWNLDKTIVRAPADGSSPTWRCAGVDVLPRWRCRRPSSTHRRRSTVSRSRGSPRAMSSLPVRRDHLQLSPRAHLPWQGGDGSASGLRSPDAGFGSGSDALMTSTLYEIVLLNLATLNSGLPYCAHLLAKAKVRSDRCILC